MENNETTEYIETNLYSKDSTIVRLQEKEADSNEIDETKLRGDSIGNTIYSQRYVLETLLKLKDSNWNAELEEDMCSLWDMTLDKDVVDFFLQINFIELSLEILKESKELRLTEILVGIIGNLCIHESAAEKTVESKDFDELLSLVFSNDIPTLIQLIRLFKSLLFCKKDDCKTLMTDDILNQINFILSSSQNSELLGYTLQVTCEITNRNKNIFFNVNFLQSIPEALKEIYNNMEEKYLSREFIKHITSFLKIIENACSLINEENDINKIKNTVGTFQASSDQIVPIIEHIIAKYIFLDFMQEETQSFEYILYCCVNYLVSFRTETNDNIFETFSDTYLTIIENNLKDTFETDVCDCIANYITYYVENKNQDLLQHVLEKRTDTAYKSLFDHIINHFQCSTKFINIVNELKTS